ncbi:hypothetical protein AAFF_G00244770 [Aldrovandia affinis]|uniref:Uncharacterized protein n=1 Tax=Aldrovandia affinis TaxID=143900 RepID=A0AAD7RE32_9TELE|nr:hypothetical protein AAFF_G00244770 [Aldrovandia affinis]
MLGLTSERAGIGGGAGEEVELGRIFGAGSPSCSSAGRSIVVPDVGWEIGALCLRRRLRRPASWCRLRSHESPSEEERAGRLKPAVPLRERGVARGSSADRRRFVLVAVTCAWAGPEPVAFHSSRGPSRQQGYSAQAGLVHKGRCSPKVLTALWPSKAKRQPRPGWPLQTTATVLLVLNFHARAGVLESEVKAALGDRLQTGTGEHDAILALDVGSRTRGPRAPAPPGPLEAGLAVGAEDLGAEIKVREPDGRGWGDSSLMVCDAVHTVSDPQGPWLSGHVWSGPVTLIASDRPDREEASECEGRAGGRQRTDTAPERRAISANNARAMQTP